MTKNILNLGVIGLSPGNGHPYSWSAIFNGYDAAAMESCPFPAIPEYLSKQNFPDDAISGASVTHIWCDDPGVAQSVASAALIPTVVDKVEDMADAVDAILLARDDAENHLKLAAPFIEKGMPIYIDKPLGYTVGAAEELLDMQLYEGQIFSCSALRFDPDMLVREDQLAALGEIERIEAFAPKSWERYAIHVLDPLCATLLANADVQPSEIIRKAGLVRRVYEIDRQFPLTVCVNEVEPSPIEIVIKGENGSISLKHSNSFRAFKIALEYFVNIANRSVPALTRQELLASIKMIDKNYEKHI
jgi:hypothetical protein